MELKDLKTKNLGQNIIYTETIDSTQLEIWRRIEKQQIENGTIIFSDIQTNGKGTHGREWFTQEKNNIAFSFYIKLDINVNKIQGITLEIAETIVEVFRNLYGISLNIKYPNDIVYNNKKIGGILTETKIKGQKVLEMVVGIGINTNQETFNQQIANTASSIKKEFNIEIDNKKILSEFCNLFEPKINERIFER